MARHQAAIQALTRDLRSRQALTRPYCVSVSCGSSCSSYFAALAEVSKWNVVISIGFCVCVKVGGKNPPLKHMKR